jgi:phosphatidylinositol-3-phosphatase
MQLNLSFSRLVAGLALAGAFTFGLTSCGGNTTFANPQAAAHHIQNVFIIMMENHNWTGDGSLSIQNNANAPYLNKTLVPMGSYASNYNNPPQNHPSLPNYLWLEAGTNFGILQDGPSVSADSQTTTQHLVALLEHAGISWKDYSGTADGITCPLIDQWHIPFVFFSDITGDLNPNSPYCISHIRPISELDTDLAAGATARYNFITPDDCHNMHSSCSGVDQIVAGDDWLSQEVPKILASKPYQNGVLFIVFDEADKGDGPIPMLVLSPFAKTGGYTNSIYYEHGSTLRTVEEIFGVSPLLRDAAQQTDLSDFFTQFP